MSIQGVSLSSALQSIASIQNTYSSLQSASVLGADSTSSGGSYTTKISKPAEMLSKLQELKTKDPEKFKETVAAIAEKLKSAAEAAGDTPEGQMLAGLAEKFTKVANGADLSELEPPTPSMGEGPLKSYSAESNAMPDPQMMLMMMGKQDAQKGPRAGMDDTLNSIISEIDKALSGL